MVTCFRTDRRREGQPRGIAAIGREADPLGNVCLALKYDRLIRIELRGALALHRRAEIAVQVVLVRDVHAGRIGQPLPEQPPHFRPLV